MHSSVSKYFLGSVQVNNNSYYIVIVVIERTSLRQIYYVFGSFHVLCLVFADGLMVQFKKFKSYTADLHASFKGRKSWYDAVYKYMTTQHLDRSNKLNKRSSYALGSLTDFYCLNLKNCKSVKCVLHATPPIEKDTTRQQKLYTQAPTLPSIHTGYIKERCAGHESITVQPLELRQLRQHRNRRGNRKV